jgi:hypothetical protein
MAATSVTSFLEQDTPRAKKQKDRKINHRKYEEAYIERGFFVRRMDCNLSDLYVV